MLNPKKLLLNYFKSIKFVLDKLKLSKKLFARRFDRLSNKALSKYSYMFKRTRVLRYSNFDKRYLFKPYSRIRRAHRPKNARTLLSRKAQVLLERSVKLRHDLRVRASKLSLFKKPLIKRIKLNSLKQFLIKKRSTKFRRLYRCSSKLLKTPLSVFDGRALASTDVAPKLENISSTKAISLKRGATLPLG